MGDQACEIEEIEEEATVAAVQERRKMNNNPPDYSDSGPRISPRDISPTLAQNGGDKTDEERRHKAQNGGDKTDEELRHKAQNGGDKTDKERRHHKKGKEGSGGLPLYLFLQESVASEGGKKKVDPRCRNASNPYHLCTDHCFAKMNEAKRDDAPKSPFSFLSRHSSLSSTDGSSREGRKVDSRCPNSSNPYHQCTDNCHSKFHQTDRENGAKSPFPLFSRNSPTSSDGLSREGRKVDARCPNSSNPYHECTDSCHSKFHETDREDGTKSPFRLFSRSSPTSRTSSGKLVENRSVDPKCVNASNPYHECGEHCSKKLQEGNHTMPKATDSSTSSKSKGSVQKVERREEVYPDCANASNPYHKCGNSCLEKMQR